jgi:hypothetical protein
MIPRKIITNFFASVVYPLNPSYFKKIVNFAVINEFMKSKKSKNFQIIRATNKQIPKTDSEEIEEFHFIKNILGDDMPIIFLEFGVYEGKSIKNASKIFSHPKSRFIGFDSFEGLPESWGRYHPKGTYDVKGRVPKLNDDRVFFIKRLFQNTLSNFMSDITKLNQKTQIILNLTNSALVINMDADVFSSTLFCLTKLDPIIKSGTIIRFDEFLSLEDECIAFYDYVRSYYKDFEILAANDDLLHVIIRIK